MQAVWKYFLGGEYMDMVVGMPVVQMLLLAIMFLAIMVEIKTGGLGAGILLGLVAAVSFGAVSM